MLERNLHISLIICCIGSLLKIQPLNAQISINLDGKVIKQIESVDSIQIELDTILSSEDELGTQYCLKDYSYQNEYQFDYTKSHFDIDIDSIIINDNYLHPFVNQKIIAEIADKKSSNAVKKYFENVISTYPFLTRNSKINFFLHNHSKVGLDVDIASDFNSNVSGLAALENRNNSWQLNGQIDMHFENVWHTAGVIDLHWRRLNEETQSIFFKIEEPFLYFAPFGTRFVFEQDYREGSYISNTWEIALLRSQPGIGLWSFGYKSENIFSTPKGDSLGIKDIKYQSFLINTHADHRNNLFLPTQGQNWDISIYIGNSNKKQFTGEYILNADIYYLINPYFSLHGKLFSKGIFGPTHDALLVRYGGMSTLRGYNEDIFSGSFVVIPTIEGLINLNEKLQINLFSETAIQDDYSPIPMGFGFGLTQALRQTIFSIQYGLNIENQFTEGKIHLSITSRI